MSLGRLCRENLLYHWRGNTAVFLGMVVGSTVLTGSLLVGDSLRGSLAEQANEQRGWVEQALVATRLFRQDLAGDLEKASGSQRVCPVLLLQGTALRRTRKFGAISHQAGSVTILAVEESFWAGFYSSASIASQDASRPLWLNSTLARALEAEEGDEVSLRLQKPSAIPRESLLGRRDDSSQIEEVTFPVGRVLQPGNPGDAFSLRPQLQAPRTAFMPLSQAQKVLGLDRVCNGMLARGDGATLSAALKAHLTLTDWGLRLEGPHKVNDSTIKDTRVENIFHELDKNHDRILQPREWRDRLPTSLVAAIDPDNNPHLTYQEVEEFYLSHRPYLALESKQLFLEPAVVQPAREAARASGLRAAPTLVYLANSLTAGNEKVPYVVVAALEPEKEPPLGPFLPPGVAHLADDQIVLADWKEMSLPQKANEDVTLRYYTPEHSGEAREATAHFRLAGVVALSGVVADAGLTPQFPGITDKLSLADWNPPFRLKEKISPRDEHYWRDQRTTPRAFITLAAGQRLWHSRFGDLTSIRLAAEQGRNLAAARGAYERSLHEHLDPQSGGFVFQDLRAQAHLASMGGTDFSVLFLSFSFFLIASALLLVGLLFRLNLDRRSGEIGLLLALGYRQATIRWLLLCEGGLLAALGALAGSALAILYCTWLLQMLGLLWPDPTLRSILRPLFTGRSLAVGAITSLLASALTITWSIFSLGRMPATRLLAGQTSDDRPRTARGPKPRLGLALGSLVGGVVLLLLSGKTQDHELQAMTFFGSGALLLIACLSALSAWMRRLHPRPVEGHGAVTIARLGIRNATRHPTRSLLTAGLLASAAFLLVAVEAFRRQADFRDAVSAAGGFSFVGESAIPLLRDPSSREGKTELLDRLLVQYRDEAGGDNRAAERQVAEARRLLDETEIVSFRAHAGDDVSCLNLYQPLQPRVLGVPSDLAKRSSFRFADSKAMPTGAPSSPWALLDSSEKPFPAFGEKETVEWILHSGLGQTVLVSSGSGSQEPLEVVGLLQDSVFQSSLLVSEGSFLRLYPEQEGYTFFLVRPPSGQEEAVRQLLERGLAERGLELVPATERLATYLAVVNMYLSTFQALGGLGLILGSLGLAVVLLRGAWERRGELALLRALGYSRGTLAWLVLSENAFLLLVGLAAGSGSALVAVSPHLSHAVTVPWPHLLALLAGAALAGLVAGALATLATLRAPLVPALRRE